MVLSELLPYLKNANLFVLQHLLGPLFFNDKVANKFIEEFCWQEEMEGLENRSSMLVVKNPLPLVS